MSEPSAFIYVICFIAGAASTSLIAHSYIRRHLRRYGLVPVLPIATEINELAHAINKYNKEKNSETLHIEARAIHGRLLRIVKQYYRTKAN